MKRNQQADAVPDTEDSQGENRPDRGCLFIVSAPSGAGKTTLCNLLRKRFPDLAYSVSYTTREPRGKEKDGVDYHFISKEKFEKRIRENRWAEWAEVHGNYYGTSADILESFLSSGRHILLDIDVQGAFQIVERYPESVTIFIMPPSMEALRFRLKKRGTDKPETIDRRIQNAQWEMAQKDRYQYIIINDELKQAEKELVLLVKKHREKRSQESPQN